MTSERLYYHRQWFHQRLHKWVIYPLFSRLYRDTDPDAGKSMLVAGTGRSGTTWVAQIISSQLPSRVMFEPFYSTLVAEYAGFNYFQYMRPEQANEALHTYCQRVFSGTIRHAWIDRMVNTINPQYRVVKEIRANLFLKWIRHQFAAMPLLFVIRHPCAVVRSRMQLGWATDGDIQPFLSQPDLIDDYLSDKMDIIEKATTPEQKHAIVWCISNLIPIRQFASGELPVIFYEHLCLQPQIEIPRIFKAIGQAYDTSVFKSLNRPASTATRDSAIMSGRDKVNLWRSQLSPGQQDDILSIVHAFGLDHIYGDSPLPVANAQDIFRAAQ